MGRGSHPRSTKAGREEVVHAIPGVERLSPRNGGPEVAPALGERKAVLQSTRSPNARASVGARCRDSRSAWSASGFTGAVAGDPGRRPASAVRSRRTQSGASSTRSPNAGANPGANRHTSRSVCRPGDPSHRAGAAQGLGRKLSVTKHPPSRFMNNTWQPRRSGGVAIPSDSLLPPPRPPRQPGVQGE